RPRAVYRRRIHRRRAHTGEARGPACHRRRHHHRTRAGITRDRRRRTGLAPDRQRDPLHPSRLPVPDGAGTCHQLPPAEIVTPDARRRIRRPRTGDARLWRSREGTLPVLQLWGCDGDRVIAGLWTLDFGLWTLDFGPTLDFRLWTLDFGSAGESVASQSKRDAPKPNARSPQ